MRLQPQCYDACKPAYWQAGVGFSNRLSITAMADKPIGTVTHWYDKIGVAVVKLTGKLAKGARVKVKKGTEEFEDTVSSLQIDHKDVAAAKKGDDAAMKLSQRAKEGAELYLVE